MREKTKTPAYLPVGEIEITEWYSDNEMHLREVRFLIPAEWWTEYERSQAYHETIAFVDALKTQYKKDEPPELQWPEETEEYEEREEVQAAYKSVWDQVRRAFHRR